MGTIRLFNYPYDRDLGYYQAYSKHLNFVNQCVVSKNLRYLLTTSRRDRSIFVWRIKEGSPISQSELMEEDGMSQQPPPSQGTYQMRVDKGEMTEEEAILAQQEQMAELDVFGSQ